MPKGVATGYDGRKDSHTKRGSKHNETLEERILSRIETAENGCILWTRDIHPCGYGRVFWKGSYLYVHVAVYELFIGPVPDGMDVGHKCHDEAAAAGLCNDTKTCPHRACCNLEHLCLEPRQSNLLASPLTQAAINKAKTHCKRNHEFTPENTGWRLGKWRFCRACNRMTKEERAAWDSAHHLLDGNN